MGEQPGGGDREREEQSQVNCAVSSDSFFYIAQEILTNHLWHKYKYKYKSTALIEHDFICTTS